MKNEGKKAWYQLDSSPKAKLMNKSKQKLETQ